MSATDLGTGRITGAPTRSFGTRPVLPAPAPPRTQPFREVAWDAFRRTWQRSKARLPGLQQQALQTLARLPRLSPPSLERLHPFWRRVAGFLAALKPSRTWSREAVFRAVFYSDASTTFLRLTSYVGALAVLALIAVHVVRSNAAIFEPAPVAPGANAWMTVARPFPAFSLPQPELAESGYEYAMRRHASGGRQDILCWGAMENDAPHLRVEIYRAGDEMLRFENAALEIAARLENIETALIKPAGTMETKFGATSLAEFSTKPGRRCLGFARAYEDPRVQVLGWHCVSGDTRPERDVLACAFDRLSLLAAGREPKVRELFARAELKRNFCGQRSPLLAATPRLGSAPPPDATRRVRATIH